MAYTKTEWKDRVVERPRTYTITDNPDGTVTLTPAPGTVLEEGTPVNAANLGNLGAQYEQAKADLDAKMHGTTGHNHNGSAGNGPILPAMYSAGDFLIASADDEGIIDRYVTYYEKNREIQVGGAGSIRVSFDMKATNDNLTVWMRIYKNGVAVGTERVMNTVTYATFTEDISDVQVGDRIQLYAKAKSDTYGGGRFKNFRIYVASFYGGKRTYG